MRAEQWDTGPGTEVTGGVTEQRVRRDTLRLGLGPGIEIENDTARGNRARLRPDRQRARAQHVEIEQLTIDERAEFGVRIGVDQDEAHHFVRAGWARSSENRKDCENEGDSSEEETRQHQHQELRGAESQSIRMPMTRGT